MNADAKTARSAVVARLHRLFERSGAEQAVQFDRRWTTWSDIGRVCDSLTGELDRCEVDGSARVAVLMRQRPALVAVELAVLAQGRAAVLVSPLVGDRPLTDDIRRLSPAVVVAHPIDWARPGLASVVAAVGALGLSIDDDLAIDVVHTPATVRSDPDPETAVTVLTSGTTGPPKRLPVTWDTFVDLGGGPKGATPVSGRGAVILTLPLSTLGGLGAMARLVFGGRPLAMMERFDVHEWAGLVREHRPKMIGAPPAVLKMVLDADIPADHFASATAYYTGSAPVDPDVAQRFEERYGIPVLLGYGATEFLRRVSGWTPALWSEYGATKLGSSGRPEPGVRLRVIDPSTRDHDEPTEMGVGEEGILEVDPPQRASGLPEGWLRTNDRARIDEDGFLWILGRVDDIIIRGGFKVDLNEVANAALEHPSVIDAASVGLDDDRVGSVPGLVIVVKSTATLTDAELMGFLRDRLPPYAVPTRLVRVDRIPQTSTSKTHLVAVRELFES